MDPVSALGIAAAVIQFTDFTGRLLSRTWKTYRSPTGQTSKDSQLIVVANDLAELTSTLGSHLETGSLGRNVGVDAHLLELCRECKSISVDLQDTLKAAIKRQETLRNKRGKPKNADDVIETLKHAGDIFREAITTELWNNAKVENVRRSLESIQRRLIDAVTTSIWIDSQRTKRWESEFTNKLDHTVRMLENAVTIIGQSGPEKDILLSTGVEPLELQIRETIREKRIRDEMIELIWDPEWTPDTTLLAKFPENTDTTPKQIERAITKTLQYETIKRREQAIAPTFGSTYDWVFQRQPRELNGIPSWSSVPNWLESDASGIYWITGKPGSGKSTMMKFMMQDARLRKYLHIWSAGIPFFIGHYYAWSIGRQLDKSRTGLMRSLLHQIISVQPNLAPMLCPRRWTLFHTTRDSLKFPEWSEWELEESLMALVRHAESNMRILLFIDGLDEFEAPPMEIITLIGRIAAEPSIKICAASRPWPEFRDAFLGRPSMQMHHLNHEDIKMYTNLHFSKSPGFLEVKGIYPEAANSLVNDVVAKSKGVFLWTTIVTKNLLVSLSEGANLQKLRIILDQLPEDIEKLYDAIFATIPPRLLPETSVMLLIFKAACHPLDWFSMWLADEFRGANLHPDPAVDVSKLWTTALPSLKRRLAARTRGLLEVSGPTDSQYIGYLHRTVAEWIERPGVWEQISSNLPSDFDPYACLFLAEMLLMYPLHPTSHRQEFWESIARSLFYASLTRCPSVNTSESQLVTAMDTINLRAQQVFNTFPGNNQTTNHIWTQDTGRPTNFLGLAAEFCVAPYVRANVTENSSQFKELCNVECGLLKQAIFGPQAMFRKNAMGSLDLNVIPKENRIQLVKFLIQHKVESNDDLREKILRKATRGEEYFQEIVVLMGSKPGNGKREFAGKLFKWRSSRGR